MFDDKNPLNENRTYEEIANAEINKESDLQNVSAPSSDDEAPDTGSFSKIPEPLTGDAAQFFRDPVTYEANVPNQEPDVIKEDSFRSIEQPVQEQQYQEPQEEQMPPQEQQQWNAQEQPNQWNAQEQQNQWQQPPQQPQEQQQWSQPYAPYQKPAQNQPPAQNNNAGNQANQYPPYNYYNDYSNGNNNNPYNPSNTPPSYNPYQGYRSQGAPLGSAKKSTGFKVFVAAMAAMIIISTISLIAIGINDAVNNGTVRPQDNSSETEGKVLNPNGPTLAVESDSKATDSATVNGVNIAQIAKSVIPSVVGIVSYRSASFAEDAGGEQGSGIVISDDGYIVTNAHVIGQENSFLRVVLSDLSEHSATLIGMDSRTDLAVIKIDKKGITPAKFGDSDALEVGELLIAIGNPGGLAFASSVTQGIASALNRSITESGMKYIQTDAAINPGNSGGALVNAKGFVVGINTSKIVASGFEGMGFAIPIQTAKPIIDDLIKYGKVQGRAILGITGYTLDKIRAIQNNVEPGVVIQSVDPKSGFANQDVQQNDIITQIDSKTITSLDDIYSVLNEKKPGDTVKITLFRLGKGAFTISVKLINESSN